MIKLQVTYREVLLKNPHDVAKAQHVVTKLREQENELEVALSEEKTLNESGATRLKELEKKLEAIQNALKWMDEQG